MSSNVRMPRRQASRNWVETTYLISHSMQQEGVVFVLLCFLHTLSVVVLPCRVPLWRPPWASPLCSLRPWGQKPTGAAGALVLGGGERGWGWVCVTRISVVRRLPSVWTA